MKNKYINLIVVFILLLVFCSFFYWVQIRPSQIRKDCSWTKNHLDFYPGVTQQEADIQKEKCMEENNKKHKSGEMSDSWYEFNISACKEINIFRPSQPAKDWYEKATDKEYEFCLHSKGLK